VIGSKTVVACGNETYKRLVLDYESVRHILAKIINAVVNMTINFNELNGTICRRKFFTGVLHGNDNGIRRQSQRNV
jgi:hypothetical protein